MRLGRPVNQRHYPAKYNPILGRRSVLDNEGIFKNTARALGISDKIGYDDKGLNGILLNKPVYRSFDGVRLIAGFLNKFNNKNQKDYHITHENGRHYLKIGDISSGKHRFVKTKNYYYLFTKKDYKPTSNEKNNTNIALRIKAKNDDEFKQKLNWILCNPVSRAKLEYHVPKAPFIGSLPNSKFIDFNEDKAIGSFQMQEFKTIGDPALQEAFTSDVGGIDAHEINYFVRSKSYQGYSSLENPDKPLPKNINDKFSDRIHGMNEHILSSNRVHELLGNIVNMFYAGKNISPEHRAQVVTRMRDDFVFNLFGNGTRNSRAHQESADLFASPTKYQHFFAQFLFATNPNHGGRFWRASNIPPALSQVIEKMYIPKGNGDVECKYDKNPKEFLDNIRNFKVGIADRQFLGSYGRKILATYMALKFIKHELSFIKINDKNTSAKDIQKWKDLTELHDELFEAAGDLKDFLRHDSSGFSQVTDSVKKQDIPNIKETIGIDCKNQISKELYQDTAKKTLYPLMLNYTQFENFMGWRNFERGSSMLYNTLKTQIFERDVPDIVAGSATVMLLDGLDKISRRLKFIDEAIGRDAKLKGIFTQFKNKLKQGNIEGAYDMFKRHITRTTYILNYDTLFPNPKYHALQTEGLLWNKEIFRPIIRDYQAENQNFFVGNHLAASAIEKNGRILTAKLIEAIKMQARLIKNIQNEMKEKSIQSPYDTQSMRVLSDYMRGASKEIAINFMHDHKTYFAGLTDEETEKLFRDVLKETYGLQELIGNVASLLATGDEHAYGVYAVQTERDKKRNQKLAQATGKINLNPSSSLSKEVK